jgi:hypothetical protein
MYEFINNMLSSMPENTGGDTDGRVVMPDELPVPNGKRLRLCEKLVELSHLSPEEQLIKMICDSNDVACLHDVDHLSPFNSSCKPPGAPSHLSYYS